MKAVAIRRGEDRPCVLEKPRPTPDAGEVLVRTLRVGVDGTDHKVIQNEYREFPAGGDHMVLGHEAVGIVTDPNGTEFQEGALVVPTVRRPPGEPNAFFERGEPDMAPAGSYVERGIVGAHGYMSEFFTSPAEFLVRVPASTAAYAFLVEPISNSEKALAHAEASRAGFSWSPESAFVLGNGPLGLLTLAMLAQDDRFERLYCMGRRDRPDPTIDIIERLGATYVDSRALPLSDVCDVHGHMDLVYEATGVPAHGLPSVAALAPNGVSVLMGVPKDHTLEIDAGRLHREMVLENKAIVASVNSSVPHFEAAKDSLAAFPAWFLDDLITGVYPPDEPEKLFETGDDVIKSVVAFSTP